MRRRKSTFIVSSGRVSRGGSFIMTFFRYARGVGEISGKGGGAGGTRVDDRRSWVVQQGLKSTGLRAPKPQNMRELSERHRYLLPHFPILPVQRHRRRGKDRLGWATDGSDVRGSPTTGRPVRASPAVPDSKLAAEQTVVEGKKHDKVTKCFRVKKRRRHSSREEEGKKSCPSSPTLPVVERHH